jgi:hypothetical protein
MQRSRKTREAGKTENQKSRETEKQRSIKEEKHKSREAGKHRTRTPKKNPKPAAKKKYITLHLKLALAKNWVEPVVMGLTPKAVNSRG